MIKLSKHEWLELQKFLGHDPNNDGEWSLIPSDGCKYVVNSKGTCIVRLASRDKRGYFLKSRKLNFMKDDHNYVLCNINNESIRVHRVVAQAWLFDYREDLTVNHKDGKHDNNDISNLEMMTGPENTNHYHTSKAHEEQRISDYSHHGDTIRGRIHITNGYDGKMIHENEPIPDGWYRGRPQSMKDSLSSSMIGNVPFNKGKKIITNGKISKYISESDDIPEGWKKGSQLNLSEAQIERKKEIMSGRIYFTKGAINKRIYPDEIEKYISDGWRKGMYSKRSKKITI